MRSVLLYPTRRQRAGSRWRARGLPALSVLVLALTQGCSNYVARSDAIRGALASSDYETALKAIENIDHSNSKLLYLYEKGLTLHCQGDFAGSSAAFSESELVLEDLYTKSVTREAVTLAVSEVMGQYRGDAFEAVYVHYYQILNYLAMNDVDGAMVECRRVNRKLQMLSDGGETYFTNEPFLQYLTGLVYDLGGERESAGVSYRVAAGLYGDSLQAPVAPAPLSFYSDAARNAYARGDRQEGDAYAARTHYSAGADSGRVSLLLDCGQITRKREASVVLPIFETDRWRNNEEFANVLYKRANAQYNSNIRVKYWLKVALPVLEPVPPPRFTSVVVRAQQIDGTAAAQTRADVVADLDAFAMQAFHEKQGNVFMRAIVRSLVKYLAHDQADQNDEALGALVNIFNIATETADTRSWSSLPGCVFLGRLELPKGQYKIEADLLASDGRHVGTVSFGDVHVADGGNTIRSARAF